ncbi:MAG: LCP family protein [Chloroflexi bacterium]|nr:LCP family protein [Chloroflexota bacterium]
MRIGRPGHRSIYEQYSAAPARSRSRLPWWAKTLVLVPITLLVAGGVYVGTVVLAAQQAMNAVFVPSVRATAVAVAPPTPVTVAPGAPAPGATTAPVIATVVPPTRPPEWTGSERLNIVLLGVDKRDDEDTPRSDTMILVSIDPVGKRVGMMSIPRDLWVTVPGYGLNKINAAFPLGEKTGKPSGGAALVMQTIEANFKIPVHHFASVDFRGFTRIVDAVGGIVVDVPYLLKDDEYPADDGPNYTRLYVPAGLQWMDGATALRYARSRHFDSDFGRNRRQQQVLHAIREQGIKLDLLPRVPELLNLVAGSVRTDIDPRQLPALARLGAQIDREAIKSYGITVDMTIPRDLPEIFYLEPNWPKINAAVREMTGAAAPAPAAAKPAAAATPTRVPVSTAPPAPTARPATVTPVATVATARPRVWVRNGTRIQGLAARNADILRAKGYAIVDVSQDPEAGQYPKSIVYLYGSARQSAIAVASELGLPATAVRLGPAPAPPGTDILVILGEDAR